MTGEHRRPDEQLDGDERRHGIAGEPEDERLAAPAEGERLARLHRHAPEDLVDAELGADLANEVVRADRDAA